MRGLSSKNCAISLNTFVKPRLNDEQGHYPRQARVKAIPPKTIAIIVASINGIQ